MKKEIYWEYRIVRKRVKHNDYFGIYEVSLINGLVINIGDMPKSPFGEDMDELRTDIQKMIQAYKKDVIDFNTMRVI